jgi:hypothetical protein
MNIIIMYKFVFFLFLKIYSSKVTKITNIKY